MEIGKRYEDRVVTVNKEVPVYDIKGLTGEELTVVRNALYCYAEGVPSSCRDQHQSSGYTQAEVAGSLYAKMYA